MGWGMELANRKFRGKTTLVWKNAVGWVLSGLGLAGYLLGHLEILTLAEWQYGVLLFIVLYRLLRPLPKNLPVLGWIGSCSFMMYLLEGKLIGFLNRFATLNARPWLYLLVYAVLLTAMAAAYRLIEKRLIQKNKEGVL
jgi:peptidoglycan/LPS O-acetylase OafA/YrhL